MTLADFLVQLYPPGPNGNANIDPARVLEAVVGGVAFLGAGTIIVHRDAGRVHGLTTAAGLLFTAVLGVAAGLGAYLLTVVCTGLMLAVLALSNLVGARNKDSEQSQSGPAPETAD
jgi:putative Mg2+ transporter-C (MgtC) family protein